MEIQSKHYHYPLMTIKLIDN